MGPKVPVSRFELFKSYLTPTHPPTHPYTDTDKDTDTHPHTETRTVSMAVRLSQTQAGDERLDTHSLHAQTRGGMCAVLPTAPLRRIPSRIDGKPHIRTVALFMLDNISPPDSAWRFEFPNLLRRPSLEPWGISTQHSDTRACIVQIASIETMTKLPATTSHCIAPVLGDVVRSRGQCSRCLFRPERLLPRHPGPSPR